VTVDGKKYPVILKDDIVTVEGRKYKIKVEEGIPDTTKSIPGPSEDTLEIRTPFPGTVVSVLCKANKRVVKNEIIMIIEAMKMETEIKAPRNGVLFSLDVNAGDSVNANQILARLG